MVISEKTYRLLRALGLTEYEIKAYLTLLKFGSQTASVISMDSGIPYSKIYDVLRNLERKGWIEVERAKPSKYYPKPPVLAFNSTKMKLEKELKETELQILQELQPMFERKEIKEKPDIWIVRGEFNVLSKIKEAFDRCENELLIAIPSVPDEWIEALIPTIINLKDKNVKIMIMTTHDMSSKILKKLVRYGDLRIKYEMFGGGVIIDGKEVVLLLSGDKGGWPLAIWSDYVSLAKFAKDYFTHLWREAEKINI
ncbi:MAG: helix-turn-helix domain-containing protein [Nitrososphaerales archaeon]